MDNGWMEGLVDGCKDDKGLMDNRCMEGWVLDG